MRFTFRPFPELPEVVLVGPRVHRDARGWFVEGWREDEFRNAGIDATFVQDNHSRSDFRGVLRGLHLQVPPMAQGKLVRCTRGAIFDVAVDVRVGSPTFGRAVSATLTGEDLRMLWVPEGFAHGFQVVEAPAEVEYKVTRFYSPAHERCIRWDSAGIAWPVRDAIVSEKDAKGVALADFEGVARSA
ncbi:MAG TPA: dTDP-4-dehydrorhamnose 3,5-epimerase [Candidatus Thermoplasmatota archaeon]|nr:dTDP-4-dehydrorhamnose 3,5-epimerase [Candidatus Thermoplasmatota archaeon]